MGDVIKVRWGDELKTKGIMGEGYGLLPKYAMCDPKLPICSKTIYALICSMAGNGTSSFPNRDTILSYLQLSRDAYYKHLKILKERGYITVEQGERPEGGFSHNTYYIEDYPKPFQEDVKAGAPYTKQVTLSYTGIKGAGYGVIARSVMFDNRVSAKAKAVYAYFASYTGAGTIAFPKQDVILHHLGLSDKTYRKLLSELTKLNLVEVIYRHENGRIASCWYKLTDYPDEANGKSLKESAQKKMVATGIASEAATRETVAAEEVGQPGKKQYTQPEDKGSHQPGRKQYTQKQYAQKQYTPEQYAQKQDVPEQYTQNQDTNSTSSSNISSNSISSVEEYQSILSGLLRDFPGIDRMDDQKTRNVILEYTGYLIAEKDPLYEDKIWNLINFVAGELSKHQPFIRIKGENWPWVKAAASLLYLTLEDYEAVVLQVSRVQHEIKNVPAYYLAALVNARNTTELCAQRREEEDLLGVVPAAGNE